MTNTVRLGAMSPSLAVADTAKVRLGAMAPTVRLGAMSPAL